MKIIFISIINSRILIFLLSIFVSCTASTSTIFQKESSHTVAAIKCPLHYHDHFDTCVIGNNYGQIQTFGGFDIYMHPGIDILGKPDQSVYSVSDGIVKAILTPEQFRNMPDMWRIAISNGIDTNATTGYLYAHLNKESIPFKIGDTVKAGQQIGTLYKWFDEKYTHVHFSEIENVSKHWDGKWNTIRTASLEKHGIPDTSKPVFENAFKNQLFAFKDSLGNFLNSDSLSGKIQIIFKAYDYSNSTYKLGINEIEYEFIPYQYKRIRYGKISNGLNLSLDFYSGNKNSLVKAITIYCMDYPCTSVHNFTDRNFYYYLFNRNKKDEEPYSILDTFIDLDKFPSGRYLIKITVNDYYGNTKYEQMSIKIK